jgi:hypothetical protein
MDQLDPPEPDDGDLTNALDEDDVDADEAAGLEGPLPSQRFDSWRRRSGLGAVGTGIALGLQHVFYPTDHEPVISAPIPGDPPDADERIRVTLDPDDPARSVALIPPTSTDHTDH